MKDIESLLHGAAPDSWFSHLAVDVPGENSFHVYPCLLSRL